LVALGFGSTIGRAIPMSRRRSPLRFLLTPFLGKARRFGDEEKGAVAVEFAILALPFFTIIFAILETSMVFFAGQILDSAVQDSSRLLRTGRAQANSYTAATYRQAICNGLYGMFDCTKLKIKVQVVDNFASASVGTPINPACTPTATAAQCEWTIAESYDPGVGSSIVLVQAHYKWPTLVNLPWFNLATQKGGTRLLSAVRVFRNEPF
jgi:Flp pilus assembly protein TadG